MLVRAIVVQTRQQWSPSHRTELQHIVDGEEGATPEEGRTGSPLEELHPHLPWSPARRTELQHTTNGEEEVTPEEEATQSVMFDGELVRQTERHKMKLEANKNIKLNKKSKLESTLASLNSSIRPSVPFSRLPFPLGKVQCQTSVGYGGAPLPGSVRTRGVRRSRAYRPAHNFPAATKRRRRPKKESSHPTTMVLLHCAVAAESSLLTPDGEGKDRRTTLLVLRSIAAHSRYREK
nr:hypothetical protein Iba_chr13aCG5150 [Ipomoea batatas]